MYAPANNAATLTDRLALELGGVEACAHRENQYRDEARQWQETQERWEKEQDAWEQERRQSDGPANDPGASIAHDYRADPFERDRYLVEDPFEPGKYLLVDPFEQGNPAHFHEEESRLEDERDRRWYEEQLLLDQLGLPNEREP